MNHYGIDLVDLDPYRLILYYSRVHHRFGRHNPLISVNDLDTIVSMMKLEGHTEDTAMQWINSYCRPKVWSLRPIRDNRMYFW